jgi:DNA-binding NtrC family response regulator
MQISDWVKKRKQRGTLADIARRIVENDRPYKEAEWSLRQMHTLEALIANGCDQQKAADALGISRATICRIISPLGMSDVRRAAKAVRIDEQSGATNVRTKEDR